MKRFCCLFLSALLILTSIVAFAATRGEENALSKAKSYLGFMPFSYQGLFDQLVYEGFTETESKYAVDHCGADWYDQAVAKAESYLSFMSFSKSGLIEQLEYEGFTSEEAKYGAAIAYGESATKPDKKGNSLNTRTNPTEEPKAPEPTEKPAEKEKAGETVTVGKDFDVSSLSYAELVSLVNNAQMQIMKMDEWQEVEVPAGTYKIGKDIPEGHWTIKVPDGFSRTVFLYWSDVVNNNGQGIPRNGGSFYVKKGIVSENYVFGSEGEIKSVSWELKDGQYICIDEGSVIFTPYAGNDFKFK